jgi:hypothetical protein
MINGVLVERTVKEVVPALKTNSEGLKKVLDELVVQYKSKQDEMEKWKVCHIIKLQIEGHVLTTGRKRIMFRSYSSDEEDCFYSGHDFLHYYDLIKRRCIQSALCTLSGKLNSPKSISVFEPEHTEYETER